MSRTDGQYPSYLKIDLDPEDWPKGYWDKSLCCSNCVTHWPQVYPWFSKSPCCDAVTSEADNPPDMRWPEAVAALFHARFDEFYNEWNEDASDEDLSLAEALDEIDQIVNPQLSPQARS